jgi:hypothetical protein
MCKNKYDKNSINSNYLKSQPIKITTKIKSFNNQINVPSPSYVNY